MHRLLPTFVSLFSIIAAAAAQQQPDEHPPEALETPFLLEAAKDLDAFATLAFKNNYPRRARDAWLEVISQYDRDDAVAREALGFVRVGTAWQPKPDFEYPKADEADSGAAKMLESRWSGLAKRLGDGHRQLADQLTAANKPERAKYHLQRSLRFQPGDAKAQLGLGAKTVEGVTGTELELELLRRSRLMERAITKLTDQTFDVKPSDLKDERLDAAGVSYAAFASPNFVVFGDWEPEVLTEAAQWSERSLAFCKLAFEGHAGWQRPAELRPRFAYFKQRATWADVVRKHASVFPDVDFIVQHTSATTLGDGKTGMHLVGIESRESVFDFAVRRIAHETSKLGRDAMTEGIGHAVTGMFFGRNLIMLVAQQQKEGTATSKDRSRFDLPDMETWKDLARELAFEKGTAPAARLPLLTAAKFTVEERLKAWSFVDYLLRRDPGLMLELDRTAGKSRNDFDVMAAFQEATQLSLRGVEEDWRTFYIGDSPALAAIRNQVTPMQAVSKDAPAWLDELNRLRRQWKAKDVLWSADLSAPCRQHADYLKQNKSERGPGKENTQEAGKPGFSNTGRLFAATSVVSTRDKDPRKAMEPWWLMPGYRDVLLDRSLEMVGAYADGSICVLDVMRGRRTGEKIESMIFPLNDSQSGGKHFKKDPVPAAVDVDLLGAEARAILQKNGHGKAKEIGFPLTAHLFGADTNNVTINVFAGDEEVKGVLLHSTEGSRRIAAPGLWVFLPFQPFKKGVEIKAVWMINGKAENVTFTAT